MRPTYPASHVFAGSRSHFSQRLEQNFDYRGLPMPHDRYAEAIGRQALDQFAAMSEPLINAAYDHVWRSRTHLTDRVGQKLRVLVIGMMNSALVEFEDGHRSVSSRFGYRRLTARSERTAPPISVEPD